MIQLIMPESKMPTLDFPLLEGGEFSFDAAPDHFQILVVYRGLHCPKCKTQLQEFRDKLADIRADGMDVVAVSMDDEERAQKAVEEWELDDLPMGYSLSLLTAKALGLFISNSISDKEPKLFTEPGLFVIRPDETLYAQIIQNTPFGRPDLDDLLGGLNYAIKNDYPTRGTSSG